MICSENSILSVIRSLSLSIQVFRHIGPESPEEEIALKKAFSEELSGSDENSDIMAVILLKMITAFCNGTSQHFPVKKLLLLLWKTLILSLGGIEELKVLRAAAREKVSSTEAVSGQSCRRRLVPTLASFLNSRDVCRKVCRLAHRTPQMSYGRCVPLHPLQRSST